MRGFEIKVVGWLVFVCWASLGRTASARAQENQFVLIDTTFTATAQNTSSSEYAVAPLSGAPDSWRAPIDYASGRIHVRVQVLDKPSDLKTLCNVCFFAADTLTCMPYPPPYTATGVYESEPEMSSFWQYDVYDWTRKVERVNVVVKDENGRFVQGDPAYFPTKLHVTVTVIPPGERYVEPRSMDDEQDAGVRVEPPMGQAPAASAAGAATPLASAGTPSLFGESGATTAGTGGLGSRGSAVSFVLDAGASNDIRDYIDPGSSCGVSRLRPRSNYGIAVAIIISLCFVGRVQRRTRRLQHRVRRS